MLLLARLALLCVVLDQLLTAHHTELTMMLNWNFRTVVKMWMDFGTVDPQNKISLLLPQLGTSLDQTTSYQLS